MRIAEPSPFYASRCIERYVRGPMPGPQRATSARSRSGAILLFGGPDRVTLSPEGRAAGRLYAFLNDVQDQDGRELGLAGAAAVIRDWLAASKPRARDLIACMTELADRDRGLFSRSFQAIGLLLERGCEIDGWISIFAGLRTSQTMRLLVDETFDLFGPGASHGLDVQEALSLFLFAWRGGYPHGAAEGLSEKRKYFRKKIKLGGHYSSLDDLDKKSEIIITDLSPEGMGFEIPGKMPPRENEMIKVFLSLDQHIKKGVRKLALIKRVKGSSAGAQFCR